MRGGSLVRALDPVEGSGARQPKTPTGLLAVSPEIQNHDASVGLLIRRALGIRGTRTGAFERDVELRLGLLVASPLFFFTLSDLLDDERREHGSSSPAQRKSTTNPRPKLSR
jgi:hypothetical protein